MEIYAADTEEAEGLVSPVHERLQRKGIERNLIHARVVGASLGD